MLLRILEALTILFIIIGFVTQIVIPIVCGGKFFPLFRSENKDLSAKVADLQDKETTAAVQADIQKREDALKGDKKDAA